jgi:hypothetical protein
MTEKRAFDRELFADLWEAGSTFAEIGKVFKVSHTTVQRWAYVEMQLSKRPRELVIGRPQPTQPIAAVRMPAEPLEARADWPDLNAAVERANGRPGPQAALAMIAARYRLPVAVVQGLAGRLWASHEVTVARAARGRADVDQVRSI